MKNSFENIKLVAMVFGTMFSVCMVLKIIIVNT
jgi:hypothetical protein